VAVRWALALDLLFRRQGTEEIRNRVAADVGEHDGEADRDRERDHGGHHLRDEISHAPASSFLDGARIYFPTDT
jgi:hypothetical protein